MTEKLAEQGWMVRVETVDPVVVYFAVGKNSSREAINAVLDHPGIEKVTRIDQLTSIEIWSFKLRPNEVRTYGKRHQSPRDSR
jgi:hypothetical protein